jgi:hypothetical protein
MKPRKSFHLDRYARAREHAGRPLKRQQRD